MTKRWVGPVVMAAMFLFSLALLERLPARVPTHWNFAGEVDGWMDRGLGAFAMPVTALAVWLLLRLLPRIDPRRANYARFDETYWFFLNTMVLFLAAMQVLTLGYALGWAVDVTQAIFVLLGLMFMGLGNYLPRIRSNWWMGIRTPWTLESERVWRDTHRVAGRSFMIGGLVAVVAALLPVPWRSWIVMAGLMVSGLTPAVYSYFAWRRERVTSAS